MSLHSVCLCLGISVRDITRGAGKSNLDRLVQEAQGKTQTERETHARHRQAAMPMVNGQPLAN